MVNSIEKEVLNKKIVKAYNTIEENNVSSINEVLNILSKSFQENYNKLGDAQDAYDVVAEEYGDILKEACFVYNLSGSNVWDVSTGRGYDENQLPRYLDIIKSCYTDKKIKTLNDILSSIQKDVEKTMSNVGCDMFTALNLILEEDLYQLNSDVFVISNADCEPRIEILY